MNDNLYEKSIQNALGIPANGNNYRSQFILSQTLLFKEIALIFGMSPGAPKEVYLIQMPKSCNMSGIHFKELHQRRMLQLFRTVV